MELHKIRKENKNCQKQKIYHYTSIETLELILKNKKIRFNRLDKVDDMEESIYGSGPNRTKLGIYAFVSCWTKSEKENPALWKMYTDYKGVRIGLDAMPFKTYKAKDGFTSFFQEAMNFGSDYFILSFCNALIKSFCKTSCSLNIWDKDLTSYL